MAPPTLAPVREYLRRPGPPILIFTPCGLSVASSPSSLLFPAQQRKPFHQAALAEILEQPVVSSRGRSIPRGVKRKMSKFPLRPRSVSAPATLNYSEHIRVRK